MKVVDSYSWPDFEEIGNNVFALHLGLGDIYINKYEHPIGHLNCPSPAVTQVIFGEKEFKFCESVSISVADFSLITSKIIAPFIKTEKINDRHLGLAIKDIESIYKLDI